MQNKKKEMSLYNFFMRSKDLLLDYEDFDKALQKQSNRNSLDLPLIKYKKESLEYHDPFNPDALSFIKNKALSIPLKDWIELQVVSTDLYDKHHLTNREIWQNWGSWDISPVSSIKLPTLGGYWLIKNQQGEVPKLPLEIRQYELVEPILKKKKGLLLIKPQLIGINKYVPIMIENRKNRWKNYYEPVMVATAKSESRKFVDTFDGEPATVVIFYNFLFNSYMAGIYQKDSNLTWDYFEENETVDECYPIQYISSLGDRSEVTKAIKHSLEKDFGDITLSNFQLVYRPVRDEQAEIEGQQEDFWFYTNKNCKTVRIARSAHEEDVLRLIDELTTDDPEEIRAYSKLPIERKLQEFPKDAVENRMQFKNIDEIEGHVGIYLLFGKDKKNEWIIKVGRTKDFKQRSILYRHLVKTKNDRFQNNSEVLLVNFLSLDNIKGLPDKVDSKTYKGAEALFRNYFTYLQSPKYPTEWFAADTADSQKQLTKAFDSLKRYILNNPITFYHFLHPKVKTKIATYVRKKLKNRTPQEVMKESEIKNAEE